MPHISKVFFAIPCGEFFDEQRNIIQDVCSAANIKSVIVENHHGTDALWAKIRKSIDGSDFFVADISSGSQNVILELGYVLNSDKKKKLCILVANSASVPVDLQGFVLQKYGSFREFKIRLIEWLVDVHEANKLPFDESYIEKIDALKTEPTDFGFYEDFKDFYYVQKHWTFPARASWSLERDGIRLTNAHMPILATTLSLLQDYDFKFKGRITRNSLGWVVKGTTDINTLQLRFCVMLQISKDGVFTPHIFNENQQDPDLHYQVFTKQQKKIDLPADGWLEFTTSVRGDIISVTNKLGVDVFKADFSLPPYAKYYNDFQPKQGAIGFRCHQMEEAVINNVRIKEIG